MNVYIYVCVCYIIIYIYMYAWYNIYTYMRISYTLCNNYQCIYYKYVCARGFQIYSECVWICISMLHMFPFICVNIAVPKNGLTWILLLVWLRDAYFGTFIGCWKDKCEVPNNPWVGELLEETRPHQKEDMLNVFAWAGTFCPHEPPPWNLSINTCTGESNAAKRELCWIAIFSKL